MQDINTAVRNGDLSGVINILERNPEMIRARDMRRRTPLHWGAQTGNVEMVQILLSHGADPDAEDNHGDTPLALAEFLGNDEIAGLLGSGNVRHRESPPAPQADRTRPRRLHVERKFPMLRAVAQVFYYLAIVSGVLMALTAFVGPIAMDLSAVEALSWVVGWLAQAAFAVLFLLAASEMIKVFLDIEEHTRVSRAASERLLAHSDDGR